MFAQARARRVLRPRPADPADDGMRNWLWLRLAIGLAQGSCILLLLLAHDRGIWPGTDPYLSNGFLLAGLLAPLALLEGLGQLNTRLLLLWSGTLGFVIATLGVWLEWRGGIALVPVAATALSALAGHITARAMLREGRMNLARESWAEAAWTVSTRMLVWGAVTALAFILISSLGSAFSWMKAARFPLLGLVSAIGFTVADDNWLQRHTRSALPLCATIILPFLGTAALVLLGLHLAGGRISGASLLVLAAFLAVAIHICDRENLGGRWRQVAEGSAGAIIVALALTASSSLVEHVRAGGWSGTAVFGAAVAVLLVLYGLAILIAALASAQITLPSPRGALPALFARHKGPLLAFLVGGLCLVLALPVVARLALATKAQMVRLQRHPPRLDLSWLGRSSSSEPRAHLALLPPTSMAAASTGIAETAHRRPASARPAPTGANIVFHTEGEFPTSLLTQDWSGQAVPACLKSPRAQCDAWFLDLDGDGKQELLLTEGDGARFHGTVMKLENGRWIAAAALAVPPCPGLLSVMRNRGVLVARSQSPWRDVLVGGMRLTPLPAAATLPCPK